MDAQKKEINSVGRQVEISKMNELSEKVKDLDSKVFRMREENMHLKSDLKTQATELEQLQSENRKTAKELTAEQNNFE